MIWLGYQDLLDPRNVARLSHSLLLVLDSISAKGGASTYRSFQGLGREECYDAVLGLCERWIAAKVMNATR